MIFRKEKVPCVDLSHEQSVSLHQSTNIGQRLKSRNRNFSPFRHFCSMKRKLHAERIKRKRNPYVFHDGWMKCHFVFVPGVRTLMVARFRERLIKQIYWSGNWFFKHLFHFIACSCPVWHAEAIKREGKSEWPNMVRFFG